MFYKHNSFFYVSFFDENKIKKNFNFMIQTLSYLNVADNSGARKLMCIRVLVVDVKLLLLEMLLLQL
jgi:hypothetical protein